MNIVIAYDTETTGLPDWKNPSDDPSQPHIVQLAAILADLDKREVLDSMDVIVRPDGWQIPQETVDVHGITQERALAEGIPEAEALGMFIKMWGGNRRVAHNRTFDQRIIRIAMKRYATEEIMDAWAEKDNHDCTMLMAKPVMKLLPKGRYGYKQPKLEEAYRFYTGKELQNAHNALADAQACLDIYFAMQENRKAA